MGISLHEALDQTAEMRAGGRTPEAPGPAVQSEEAIARQNQKAMRELQSMMGGLGT